MVDKVRPLKIENSVDGTQDDFVQTETDPAEDYIAAKGMAFENNDSQRVFGDSGTIKFEDQDVNNNSTIFSLFDLRNALTNFFSSVGIAASNVRDAIVEVKAERKSGVVESTSFTGNPKTYDVIFSTPHSSVNYKININGVDGRAWSYSNKTVNGFTIDTNADKELDGEVSWSTKLVGE